MRSLPLERFDGLVADALENLPDEFLARLDNVGIVTADWPTQEQMQYHGLSGGESLLGLYEGLMLTERESYGMVLPDKITIFKRPLEQDQADRIAEDVTRILLMSEKRLVAARNREDFVGAGKLRPVVYKMKALEAEVGKIHLQYEENPLEYSPEKQAREKELQVELAELELQWLDAQGEIEKIAGELG